MPHTIVLARFQPGTSAYWLPRSGREAAYNIKTTTFVAIRFNPSQDAECEDDDDPPHLLCPLSQKPSSLSLPDASLTLGPKRAIDNPGFLVGEAQLWVQPPLLCFKQGIRRPTFVHTAPSLFVANAGNSPIEGITHQLERESLNRFKSAVSASNAALRNNFEERRKAHLRSRVPHSLRESHPDDGMSELFDKDDDELCMFSDVLQDPTYMFGELNNPHAYCFGFRYDFSLAFDTIQPLTVYDELFVYAQLCKDYRWWGVERTIQWVREMRQEARLRTLTKPTRSQPVVRKGARELLRDDPTFLANVKSIFSRSYHGSRIFYDSDSDLTHPLSCGSHEGPDGRYVVAQYLPWAFPTLPVHYPRVALSRPQIVIFDILGTMLDREGAIRSALAPWVQYSRRPRDLEEIVVLYMELEALAARRQSTRSLSVPVLVHEALEALATKLGMPTPGSPHWKLLIDTMATIVKPMPYRDVIPALTKLAQEGCKAVGLVPHSVGTMDLKCILPTLPSRLLNSMEIVPIPIPIHFPVSDELFPTVTEWCKRTQPDLQPADILVASNGMGRIVGPASINGHPTALVKRPGGIESAVPFVVGPGTVTPTPSTVVESLEELCRVVFA